MAFSADRLQLLIQAQDAVKLGSPSTAMHGSRLVPTFLFAAVSHMRTVSSITAVEILVPSGEHATASTVSVWPLSSSPTCLFVAVSHMRTVLSALAVAILVPSGEYATALT